jgi:hypothetical protein
VLVLLNAELCLDHALTTTGARKDSIPSGVNESFRSDFPHCRPSVFSYAGSILGGDSGLQSLGLYLLLIILRVH